MLWVGAARRRAVVTSPVLAVAAVVALGVGLAGLAGLAGCSSTSAEAPAPVNEDQLGWEITTYYSAVEHLHRGPIKKVTGCLQQGCLSGEEYIGYYPSDFVDAVEFLGSGLLEHGPHDGRYLNFDEQEGFWVDLVPRDSEGGILVPYVSASARADVLALGSSFQVTDCGRHEDGSAVPQPLCDQLSAPRWSVVDEIEPGFGGDRQVNLYLGDETPEVAHGDSPFTKMIGGDVVVTTALGPGEAEGGAGTTSTTGLPFGVTTTTPGGATSTTSTSTRSTSTSGLPFGATTTSTTGLPFGVTTTTTRPRSGA